MSQPGIATDIHIQRADLQAIETKLTAFGMSYFVLIDDLEKEVANEEKEVKANAFAYDFNYYTYNRLAAVSSYYFSLMFLGNISTYILTYEFICVIDLE